jgi:hypothetical protein
VEAHELKAQIEAGTYKPNPALIAAAMLQRQGVCELLTGLQLTGAQDGQTHAAPSFPRAA